MKSNGKNGEGYGRVADDVETLAAELVDSAYRVHRALGPGLLETVYERCLRHELEKRRIPYRAQTSLPIDYDGVRIEGGLRLDLVVSERIVVELKAVESFHPIHTAQLLTYLRLSGLRLGLLINFNVPLIRDGIKRVVL
jgi:GxxExxY protein